LDLSVKEAFHVVLKYSMRDVIYDVVTMFKAGV